MAWTLLAKSDTTGLKERPFTVEPRENLLVFPDKHSPGDLNEEKLKSQLRPAARNFPEANLPTNTMKLTRFREIYRTVYRTVPAAKL